MQLADLVATSRRVRGAASRRAKVEVLADCLRRAGAAEAELAAAYLAGQLPQGRIGIGYAALRRAADAAAAGAVGPALALADVDAALAEVAGASGRGSARARAERLAALFARALPEERDFLVALIAGELRQGALQGIVVEALARAAEVPADAVRRALMLDGDLSRVARAALAEAAAGLSRLDVALFRPAVPMLASPAEDVADALAKLGRAAFEWKLDGARIQVHKDGDEVRVFTRRLHDVSDRVPELVEVARALPARELILDGEALALRPDGTPQPFQATMRRLGRRKDVEAMRAALPLRSFFFDCLRADGETLIDRPAQDRFRVLEEVAGAHAIPRSVTDDEAQARAFLDSALRAGHEGVMAKSLTALYAAGSRGAQWLKCKPAHTLELVVLAAEWGHGRRRGWLSNLHLGARDPEGGGFAMLGKTFKGLTDELLAWQTRELLALETARDAHTVFVRPALVVEIAVGEIQASPRYPTGMALRFARVKRYRPDKRPEQADTVATLRALFERAQGGPV